MRSVVDQSVQELIRLYPELGELEFDVNRDRVGFSFRRIGERIETMFRDLPNTSSQEQVARNFRTWVKSD